jgi:signal transduction histidine kinase
MIELDKLGKQPIFADLPRERLHGGTIEARSCPGETLFRVTLPLKFLSENR